MVVKRDEKGAPRRSFAMNQIVVLLNAYANNKIGISSCIVRRSFVRFGIQCDQRATVAGDMQVERPIAILSPARLRHPGCREYKIR
jgi:hypothetical protein